MSEIESDRIVRQAAALGRIQPTPEAADRALRRVHAALLADQRSTRPRRMRSIVMKAGISSAVAAAILIAVGLAFLGTGAAITLADVQAAVVKKSWLHVRFDNGNEKWADLQNGLLARTSVDGSVLFVDYLQNACYSYKRGDKLMHQGEAVIYREGQRPYWKPKTAWEHEIGWIEKGVRQPGEWSKAERHKDDIDGKSLVRFDLLRKSAATGTWSLDKQIWADPKTHLPVQIREKSWPAWKEWIVGKYDFPDRGPKTVYDLGVPLDVEIIKSERGWSSAEVKKLAEAVENARRGFPSRYRAIEWIVKIMPKAKRRTNAYGSGLRIVQERGEEIHEMGIAVTYRDGVRMRLERYVLLRHHAERGPKVSPPLPTTAEAILAWTKTASPVNTSVWDGKKHYMRDSGYWWRKKWGRPRARVLLGGDASSVEVDQTPARYFWSGLPRVKATEMLTPGPGDAPGCLGVRTTHTVSDDTRTWRRRDDHYLDPKKDYLRVKKIEWTRVNGKWRKDEERTLAGLFRLSDRWWCGSRFIKTRYWADRKRRVPPLVEVTHIDVKVLEPEDFPPDAFEGQKLLKGARVEPH